MGMLYVFFNKWIVMNSLHGMGFLTLQGECEDVLMIIKEMR